MKNNYSELIQACGKEINILFNSKKGWADDEKVVSLYKILHTAIYEQIHGYLVPQNTDKAETELREIISKYVLGTVDKRTKATYIGAINPIRAKLAQIDSKRKVNSEYLSRYLELYDDFMALASFRSFKHYCLYMEEKYAPEDKKIWCYADKHGIAEGMWFCFNSMVTRGDFKTMFKQTPTGYFKTYSNICFISWLLGQNIHTDILYVLGNPSVTKKVFVGIKQQMTREGFAKVFPYYEQFKCDENAMFEINNIKDGELLISGANTLCNFKITSKDAAIDGTRFKWRFYDDITRSKDKNNATQHAKDNEMYHDDWTKRRYTEFDDYEIFSGTAYSVYDLINTQKENKGADKASRCKFKYCTINKDTATMFVKIPKLDPVTDESTLPEKYTTFSARKERERDPETFFAMEQQEPVPPTGLPFDWKKIKTYSELPKTDVEGGTRSSVCRAVLDPARTGSDNLSLGIHSKCGDLHYLVSCFYKKMPLDGKMGDGRTALEHCCDLIIEKKVVELLVETNTVSNIKQQIENILFARGYRLCKIKEKYTTQKKADKIFDNQTAILEHIVFPERKMYGAGSMMGQYMKNITTWHAKTKENDDSIDTEAMFCAEFVRNNTTQFATISGFFR